MLFNSVDFILFFPIVTAVYYLLPRRAKTLWLLAASYYFYMSWNAVYALLILTSTVITYASGLALEAIGRSGLTPERKTLAKKAAAAGSFVLNLGILFRFKYAGFALRLLGALLAPAGITLRLPVVNLLLPVGISFYTFQALSYTADVYRGEIAAEKNFLRYALFVSFFPQLVAGPIERSKNLLGQLAQPRPFRFESAREGLLLMLWGYFLKLVLADRIAIFVDTVYGDPAVYGGWYLIVATMLFAVQIYCDFSGYSVIAMGAAKILGIDLMDNFSAPYLSVTVADFWRRWHISLTSWFRDYLYIPLGGSRKGRVRRAVNILIVFLVSGLWHGAALSFVIWGGLNGLYQVVGRALMPLRDRLVSLLGLNRASLGHRLAQGLVTFALVDFSWIFFRAGSFGAAVEVIRSILRVHNPWILVDESLYACGLDGKNFRVMLLGILVLLLADCCKVRGIRIRDEIARQDYWVRWLVIAAGAAAILTFGIWGPGYNAANFIYFQF